MIRTLRDAEIQIEALRDELKKVKEQTATLFTEKDVKALINQAIRRIVFPQQVIPEQSNVFDRIFIRSTVVGDKQPILDIDSVDNDVHMRIGKFTANNPQSGIFSNMSFDGTDFVQDDDSLYSSLLSFRPNTAGNTSRSFSVYKLDPAGSALVAQLILYGDGTLTPGVDSDQDLGSTGVRWKVIYSDDLVLTNPLSVDNGGTGLNSLTTDYTLQGNGTGDVKLVAGVDNSDFVVRGLSIGSATLNYKDHSGANQTTPIVTSVSPTGGTYVFTKGVLTSST